MVFNFRRFLRRYEQPITILDKEEGSWCEETGQWDPGEETEIETQAAVVPLTDDELQSEEGGRYTADDRKMYYHGHLEKGAEVKISDDDYLVDRSKDYSQHASGLFFYMLVRKGEAGD